MVIMEFEICLNFVFLIFGRRCLLVLLGLMFYEFFIWNFIIWLCLSFFRFLINKVIFGMLFICLNFSIMKLCLFICFDFGIIICIDYCF